MFNIRWDTERIGLMYVRYTYIYELKYSRQKK